MDEGGTAAAGVAAAGGGPAQGDANGYERDDVTAFFGTYGLALAGRDLDALDERHAFPGLLVRPDTTTVLAGPEDVLDVAQPGSSWSPPQRAVAVVPRVGRIDTPGDALLWVEVRWSYRDENDAEIADAPVGYLLRRGYGTFEVCVVAPGGAD